MCALLLKYNTTGSLFSCYRYTTTGDQPAAGIRTQTLFFSERIFLIAEKNLEVKNNRMRLLGAWCAAITLQIHCRESNPNHLVGQYVVAECILELGAPGGTRTLKNLASKTSSCANLHKSPGQKLSSNILITDLAMQFRFRG